MAENNNNRLSRRNRISQGKKSVMPGGYISRGNNSQSSGQQRRPLNGEEMRRSGTRSSGNNQRPIGANIKFSTKIKFPTKTKSFKTATNGKTRWRWQRA